MSLGNKNRVESTPHVLIIGTGIAGLTAALKCAAKNFSVTVVAKAQIDEGATRYAQGGIASVWSAQDSVEEHLADTLNAGAGLCRENIAQICVSEGPERVQELVNWGVPFTKRSETFSSTHADFDLHREGGHGKRRILHADDFTGLAIERTLVEQVHRHPNIKVLEDTIAIDLVLDADKRCRGAYLLNSKTQSITSAGAVFTLLATGGAGKVYLYTSNPDTSTGDGIAMAYRAGAQIANMEFIQFHPTCLYHPSARTFLITEALRGEGAILRNKKGEEFMKAAHPMGSLAPRDIVARMIDLEMKRSGDSHVWLDATQLPPGECSQKFPTVYEMCLKWGIDMTREWIPVVPAAHYTCGGVFTDENAQTNIENLYAIGEVACTGLHGANRLASNSLLEGIVFAHRAVEHLSLRAKPNVQLPPNPQWDSGQAVPIEDRIDIAASWLEIRTLMWNTVGIVRSDRRLKRAQVRLDILEKEINEYYWQYLLNKDLIELRNLVTVAQLIVKCASLRKESRGLHFNFDYPARDDAHFRYDTFVTLKPTALL